MTEITVDTLKEATTAAKSDWKSLASLLLAALFFSAGATWMVTGYILRGADSTIRSNTDKIVSIESRQSIYESQIKSLDKRQDDILAEIKSVSGKLALVAESQARMEGKLTNQGK